MTSGCAYVQLHSDCSCADIYEAEQSIHVGRKTFWDVNHEDIHFNV